LQSDAKDSVIDFDVLTADFGQRQIPSPFRIFFMAGKPASQDSCARYNNLTITSTRMITTKR